MVGRSAFSSVHPGHSASCAEVGRKTHTGRTHGEVTDQIPDQADELNDGGDERQSGAAQL